MTPLERKSLGTVPMTKAAVESFYDVLCRSETETAVRVRKLCISHERLRAELEGAEALIEEDSKRNEQPCESNGFGLCMVHPACAMVGTSHRELWTKADGMAKRIKELEQALRYAARCSTLLMVEDTARGMGVIE